MEPGAQLLQNHLDGSMSFSSPCSLGDHNTWPRALALAVDFHFISVSFLLDLGIRIIEKCELTLSSMEGALS